MDLPADLLDLLTRPQHLLRRDDHARRLAPTHTDLGRHRRTRRAHQHGGGLPEGPERRARPAGGGDRVGPEQPSRYFAVRGRVISATTDGAAEHIETLAQRYLGTPYPWYGGRDQTRLLLTVRAESLHAMG